MKSFQVQNKLSRREQLSVELPSYLEAHKESFKENLLKTKAFYGIKRRDPYAAPYVRKFLRSYALLEYQTYLRCVSSLAQYLADNPSTKVVSSTSRLRVPLQRFAKAIGLEFMTEVKRGLLTNIQQSHFYDLDSVFLVHDRLESQLVKDALKTGARIVGLNNICRGMKFYTKLVVVNNFSEEAVDYTLWLLYYAHTHLKGSIPVDFEAYAQYA